MASISKRNRVLGLLTLPSSSFSSGSSWLQTATSIAQQYGNFNEQAGEVTQQKIRHFSTILKLHEIDNYLRSTVHADPLYDPVRSSCLLQYEYCAEMASVAGLCPPDGMGIAEFNAIGMCPDGAASFMANNCAPACQMCDKLSYQTRCRFDEERLEPLNAFQKKGELHAMFERMLDNKQLEQIYGPVTILSRPGGGTDPTTNATIFDGPFIVTYENFLTPEECGVLRRLGFHNGFARSDTGGGKHRLSNRTDVRTSSTTWCRDECHADPVVQNIHRRMVLLTGIPQENYEYLQILKYEEGEYYKVHHDYNPEEANRPQGVRLLTVFLYLSDVEEGGGTTFDELNSVGNNHGTESKPGTGGELTVQPKVGRAVIWPSVLDANPNLPDRRARHGALEVQKGMKVGANAWIHQRDYKTPFSRACHDENAIVIK